MSSQSPFRASDSGRGLNAAEVDSCEDRYHVMLLGMCLGYSCMANRLVLALHGQAM